MTIFLIFIMLIFKYLHLLSCTMHFLFLLFCLLKKYTVIAEKFTISFLFVINSLHLRHEK